MPMFAETTTQCCGTEASTDRKQAHRPAATFTAEPGRRVLFALAGLDFRPYDFYDRRKDGNKYYGYYQQLEIALHKGQVAEEITAIDECSHPQGASYQIVQHKMEIAHAPHTGHKWSKRADNRHESCNDNRLVAIFLIETVRLIEVRLLEYLRIGIAEEPFAKGIAYHIVAQVAHSCRHKQQQDKDIDLDRHIRLGSNRAGYKQQGITRQKRGHDQTGLTKDDEKQYEVRPCVIVTDHLAHVQVDIKNKIYYKVHFQTLGHAWALMQ